VAGGGTALEKLIELVHGLVGAVSKYGLDKIYKLDRSYYTTVLEPRPGSAGTRRYKGNDFTVELTRFDKLYGYLRIVKGECRIEGILRYRQWHIEFKPNRVEGNCEGVEREARGITVEVEE